MPGPKRLKSLICGFITRGGPPAISFRPRICATWRPGVIADRDFCVCVQFTISRNSCLAPQFFTKTRCSLFSTRAEDPAPCPVLKIRVRGPPRRGATTNKSIARRRGRRSGGVILLVSNLFVPSSFGLLFVPLVTAGQIGLNIAEESPQIAQLPRTLRNTRDNNSMKRHSRANGATESTDRIFCLCARKSSRARFAGGR